MFPKFKSSLLLTLALSAFPVSASAEAAGMENSDAATQDSDGTEVPMHAGDETKAMASDAVAGDGADNDAAFYEGGGRLLLTSGVSQIEGAGGGGLSPWALIGGYGTRDEFGASFFATGVNTQDYSLTAFGGLISYANRIEVSVARQSFNLNKVGAALGLGPEFSVRQTIVGAKLKLIGDAVLEQDSLLPQISAGVQYKHNDEGAVVRSLGARDNDGVDYYVSATKVILSQSLLLNATARLTKANQFGILGFGGPGEGYSLQGEASAALLLTRKLAIGGEYRTKPDNLGLKEDDAFDAFIAFAPTRNVSLTLAYVDLGSIAREVTMRKQRGVYASLQFGF